MHVTFSRAPASKTQSAFAQRANSARRGSDSSQASTTRGTWRPGASPSNSCVTSETRVDVKRLPCGPELAGLSAASCSTRQAAALTRVDVDQRAIDTHAMRRLALAVVGMLSVARCQCPPDMAVDSGTVVGGGGVAGGGDAAGGSGGGGGGGGNGGGSALEEDAGPPLPATGCEVTPLAGRATPECQPPPGACATGSDCPSGLCLRLASGATCTQRCGPDAGCPSGWNCTSRETGAGLEGYCAPPRRTP